MDIQEAFRSKKRLKASVCEDYLFPDSSIIKEGSQRSASARGERFASTYTLGRKLADGSFGSVYSATHNVLGIRRAVKRLSKTNGPSSDEQREAEVKALLALDHPHVVKLVEYFDEESWLLLVFELCEGPDLFDRIDEEPGQKMTENDSTIALRHMLKALQCCHAHYRGHFDVKPENFMYTTNDKTVLKMVDLGLSGGFAMHRQNVKGTEAYMAPEFWHGVYGPEGDIWSCGVVLFEMLTGEKLLDCVPQHRRVDVLKSETSLRAVLEGRLQSAAKKNNLSQDVQDLLRTLLQHDRHERPTVREALKHPFYARRGERNFRQRKDQDSPSKEAIEICSALPTIFRKTAAQPMLKRLACLALAHISEASAPESLAFRMLDQYGFGELSITLLEKEFAKSGVEVPSDFDELFQRIDLNRDGYIGYLTFLAAVLPRCACCDAKLCTVVFDIFDTNKDGTICAVDVAVVLGHSRGSKICNSMLMEVSHTGCLSREQFAALMAAEP